MDVQRIEKAIHEQIPLSKEMGIEVRSASGDHVVVAAPLAPNRNHKDTVFGGSIYSAAVLACWASVSTALEEQGYVFDYVVIQDGQMHYETAVDGDFEAESSWATPEERARFLAMVAKKGRGRASMTGVVRTGKTECAKLQARFAVQVRRAT